MRVVQFFCRSLLCQPLRGFIGDVRRRRCGHVCPLLLAILLLVSLVALLPLASADPSDPTWLVGIYDEADGDSVVWLIESMELTIHSESASEGKSDSDVSRPLRATEALRCPSDRAPAIISLLASPSRAPPFGWCDGVPSPLSFHLLGTRKPVPAVQAFDTSYVEHSDETGKRALDPRPALVGLVPRAPRP